MQKLSWISFILLRYGVALLGVGVAIVVRDDVSPFVEGPAALLATVTSAVIFGGWLGGKGPAAVAAILGLLVAGAPTYPEWHYVTRKRVAAHPLEQVAPVGIGFDKKGCPRSSSATNFAAAIASRYTESSTGGQFLDR